MPPPPVADWRDRALTPGDWRYGQDASGSTASYGLGTAEPALTLRCDNAARQMTISRPGTAAGALTLRATNGAKSYAAKPTGGGVAAEVAVRDPQLDALAFSRGRILVSLAGAPDIVVPTWPELVRVIEDCRG